MKVIKIIKNNRTTYKLFLPFDFRINFSKKNKDYCVSFGKHNESNTYSFVTNNFRYGIKHFIIGLKYHFNYIK